MCLILSHSNKPKSLSQLTRNTPHSLTHSLPTPLEQTNQRTPPTYDGQRQRQRRRSPHLRQPLLPNHSLLRNSRQLPQRPTFPHRQRLRKLPERNLTLRHRRLKLRRRLRFLPPRFPSHPISRNSRALPPPCLSLLQESPGLASSHRGC